MLNTENASKTELLGGPAVAQQLKTQHSVHEDTCPIPGLGQWDKDMALPQTVAQVADIAQIWLKQFPLHSVLCCRLVAAILIRPLAREHPYATNAALK